MGLKSEKAVCVERAEFESDYRVRDTFLDGLYVHVELFLYFCGYVVGAWAQTLLESLTDLSLPPEERVDVQRRIENLDIKHWALIPRAFDR